MLNSAQQLYVLTRCLYNPITFFSHLYRTVTTIPLSNLNVLFVCSLAEGVKTICGGIKNRKFLGMYWTVLVYKLCGVSKSINTIWIRSLMLGIRQNDKCDIKMI